MALRELNLNMLLGGPVLALPMQEGAGAIAHDISGFGNDGIFGAGAAAPSWVRLPSGLWYLDFDGTDDSVSCGTDASLRTQNVTVECWLYVPTLPSAIKYIMGNGHRQNGWKGYTLTIEANNKPSFLIAADASFQGLTAGNVILVDTWYHVVGATDADYLYIYVNGLQAAAPIGRTITTMTWAYEFNLGEQPVPGYRIYDFNGGIALPRVYNRALSAAEISNNYNRAKHYFSVFNGNILARLLALR